MAPSNQKKTNTLTIDGLLTSIAKNYPPKTNTADVVRAYEYAKDAHASQVRLTGEPYIKHPLAAAIKLSAMRLEMNVIIAAILHDVPEDTDRTIEDIERAFGSDVAKMVAGVTKLGKVQYHGEDRYVENLRRMFYAMAEDVRTIFIKFADRLHNLETLYVVPEQKRERIAKEALEIYAPIANRLGMGEMRGDLEDTAFANAYPKEYQSVMTLLARTVKQKEKVIEKVIELAQSDVNEYGITIDSIEGRIKRLYSLHKKLQRYNNDISKIYDIIAVRIIVGDVSDCYTVLGLLHKRWRPLAGRIKDYISQPKPNGYQSLHTTVFAGDEAIVEFQIRTQEMHELDEYGVAAHWRYKEGGGKLHSRDLKWMEELVKVQKTIKSKSDFLEHMEEVKLEVFKDRIFVFTPKGGVIDLPENSTPIDFAYAIHTDIGNKCVGSRINDKLVNLDTELQSGDMCEIIINKNRKGPNADWLKFAKTNQARSKIRDATRSTVRIWIDKIASNKNLTKKKS
ncbi:MAG: RelA/SpoT family protein [Patescibacteria group bacterium]